jgi:hypothetical protein
MALSHFLEEHFSGGAEAESLLPDKDERHMRA